MLSDVTACYAAGGLHSCGRRIVDTLAWSSCSSPPAPTSTIFTAGRAVKKRTPLQAAGCGSVLRGRRTALLVAANNERARVVELLVAAGADLAVKSASGCGRAPRRTCSSPSDAVYGVAAGRR